jgi:hypothetical protein
VKTPEWFTLGGVIGFVLCFFLLAGVESCAYEEALRSGNACNRETFLAHRLKSPDTKEERLKALKRAVVACEGQQ